MSIKKFVSLDNPMDTSNDDYIDDIEANPEGYGWPGAAPEMVNELTRADRAREYFFSEARLAEEEDPDEASRLYNLGIQEAKRASAAEAVLWRWWNNHR